MHYFYYFLDSSGLYYGGITSNIAKRQNRHRKELKSTAKDWHLLQDPITLTLVWTFKTKKEAAAYEKQWIINNYKNPFCLNCSVSNSEYEYENHRALSEAGGSPKQVPLFLIDTGTGFITQIESSYEGERLGLGIRSHLSGYSKLNCLKRVKTCLVARSESEAKSKLEAWLLIPGNDTIYNPIVLTLGKSDSQFTLWKLANVNRSNFSQMYNEVINPSTRKPRRFSVQSKADFVWYGTEVKAGDWFRCTKAIPYRLESFYDSGFENGN